ncbi:hypothetical protein [Quatrionicoccus australiensis]|uniref:hypothetical protein n=1 Tax=Quatrionicoccus australiensis TaxID=138118 RepID=UPI001CFBF025|nr:hypothetical protein [Quatrionicoccus australiensis]MCB4359557.1 hypothetical protein [Quatrionicoccus australiensis]
MVTQIAFWLLLGGLRWWLGPWGAVAGAACMMLATVTEVRRLDLRLLQLLNLGAAAGVFGYFV